MPFAIERVRWAPIWQSLLIGASRDISIRRPLPADGEAFTAAMRESATLHAPWISPATDATSFALWLERAQDGRCEHRLVLVGGGIAGFVTLSEIVRGAFQNAFLAYAGTARHAGSGAITIGAALVLDEAFGELALHRVEANIQPENERSLALVRRLGFVREGFSEAYLQIAGRWRDHERWALRSEQWLAGRIRARSGYAAGK